MAIFTDYNTVDVSVTDIEAINNSIKNIIYTKVGSVPGKPTFGSNIHKVIFDAIDHITINSIETYIRESLGSWEPRIQIEEIEVKEIPEYNKVITTIYYKYIDFGIVKAGSTTVNLNI